MDGIRFILFGRLEIWHGEKTAIQVVSKKARELLCYLLLHRDQPIHRESLADRLWGHDTSTNQSKKRLRQSTWYIQNALQIYQMGDADSLLQRELEWIRVHPKADYWLDVAEFEQASIQIQAVPGADLTEAQLLTLQRAADLYRGDLLEGWYYDWCVCERERLQTIYLSILDKLLTYCEQHRLVEEGRIYGSHILRYDRAREQTHRRLMHLYYRTGYRADALRQYENCVTALKEELDVAPARSTTQLFEKIRSSEPAGSLPMGTTMAPLSNPPSHHAETPSLQETLHRLQHLQSAVSNLETELQHCIQSIQQALQEPPHQ